MVLEVACCLKFNSFTIYFCTLTYCSLNNHRENFCKQKFPYLQYIIPLFSVLVSNQRGITTSYAASSVRSACWLLQMTRPFLHSPAQRVLPFCPGTDVLVPVSSRPGPWSGWPNDHPHPQDAAGRYLYVDMGKFDHDMLLLTSMSVCTCSLKL